MLSDLQQFLVPGIGLLLLAAVVLGLAIYRFTLARQQDMHIHFTSTESAMVGVQANVAQRLSVIDRWGQLLTVLALVYFLVLTCAVLYQQWLKVNPQY